MADSNRTQLSFAKQTAAGTKATGAYKEVLGTGGGNFGQSQTTVRSATIRSDAQRAGSVRTSVEPNMTQNFEFSAEAIDDLMEAVIRSAAWTTLSVTGISITTTVDTTDKELIVTAASDQFNAVEVNQWVQLAGYATAADANNGWWRVKEKTNTVLTLYDPGSDGVAASASTDIVVKGSRIINGTESPFYTWQRIFKDQPTATQTESLLDVVMQSLSLDISLGSIITGSVSGAGTTFAQESSNLGSSITAADGNQVMADVDSFDAIWLDGQQVDWNATAFSLAIASTARPRRKLGSVAAIGVSHGTVEVTGNVSAYLDANSWNLVQKYIDGDRVALAAAVTDAEGNSYLFELPRCLLSSEAGATGSQDEDKLLTFDLEAELDTDGHGKTIQIARALA